MTEMSQSPQSSFRILVLLPAYNEAPNIAPLLDRIAETLQDLDYHVIVVDDGSSDATADIVSEKSAQLPLTLLRHRTNLGLGNALKTGIEHCRAKFPESSLLKTIVEYLRVILRLRVSR